MPTGDKHDLGKLRYDLVAPEGLKGLVEVLTFGATKYADRNWEKGLAWGRVFAALMRHMWAWWNGESIDPETGLSHLHHAACNIHFLQTYETRHTGTDDRPKPARTNEEIFEALDDMLIHTDLEPDGHGGYIVTARSPFECDDSSGSSCTPSADK